MTNFVRRNFPTAKELSKGANYSLLQNRPYGKRIHSDRLQAVGMILAGKSIQEVAVEFNCCKLSVRNWVKTFSDNTPRLDG